MPRWIGDVRTSTACAAPAHHSISVNNVVGAMNDIRRSSDVNASAGEDESPIGRHQRQCHDGADHPQQHAHVAAVRNDLARRRHGGFGAGERAFEYGKWGR